MKKTIGFIGAGNMGKAMMRGMIHSKMVEPTQMIMSDHHKEHLDEVSKYKVTVTKDNKELAKKADIIILSVKPNIYPLVIEEIKDMVKEHVMIITIAAGKTIESIQKAFGRDLKVIRTMPNTPALVGEGMTSICYNDQVSEKEIQEVQKLLEGFGKVEIVQEKLMDAVTSVSGSSPAYVFMFIEAMADAAVLDGIPRKQAYEMAAQAVLGSAKMVLQTGMHPAALKDMVCSPGGTTIEAVATLEKEGFRSSIMEAMKRCTQKSREMTKKR